MKELKKLKPGTKVYIEGFVVEDSGGGTIKLEAIPGVGASGQWAVPRTVKVHDGEKVDKERAEARILGRLRSMVNAAFGTPPYRNQRYETRRLDLTHYVSRAIQVVAKPRSQHASWVDWRDND